MKRFIAFVVLLLALMLSRAQAQQTPDDQYANLYTQLLQADSLYNNSQWREALTSYQALHNELEKFQKAYPDWNPEIVNFRIKYLANRIAEASAKLSPAAAKKAATATNAPPPATSTNAAAEPTAGQLQRQVQQLQADNFTLREKLKEALRAQPAAVDPRELAQARDRIRTLMKENALLKATQAKPASSKTEQPQEAHPKAGPELQALHQSLAEAKQKLAEAKAQADKLANENQSLQTRVQLLLSRTNAPLPQRTNGHSPTPPSIQSTPGPASKPTGLAHTNAPSAHARSAADVAWLEKMALEKRLRRLQAASTSQVAGATSSMTASGATQSEVRIHQLEQERDNLLARLAQANQEPNRGTNRNTAGEIADLKQQVATLRARVAVDEAQTVPYTTQELALLQESGSASSRSHPEAEKGSVRDLPAGSEALVAEAQKAFAAHQYDKAEQAYQQILKRDPGNPLVLANLAAIELERHHLTAAEQHIQAALARRPNDAYNLSILGQLKYRQGKYDEALDALSRAAKLDPQNPEIENYLGVVLGHKGLRHQAESALRKAVELDPHYGAAHNNLAVILLSQRPPMVALARWHYEQALADGQPHNPDLEKLLKEKREAENNR